MNNKEQAWRLEDENGKKMGKAPQIADADVRVFLGGQEVGRVQPLHIDSFQTFQQEYLGVWNQEDAPTRPIAIQRRTVEQELPHIENMIYEEVVNYEANFGRRAEFISLSKTAYESLYINMRHNHSYSRSHNEDTFMGLELVCNPLQERHVMVLGRPRQEAFERGLYSE
jgi:hypothetical protein